ncbi:hypothetical protein Halha_1266 [Halobacteroides halobius DSM 5150]|uniref:Uncharacterized protein n=1 Tax=Halobacteroides halobius (strain ATCC 35273 / DSM 5150 / MD-1) TaxID=748449 RepID=L0K7E9_HALHC|nr:hypothetical protein [Halobacteroides halobius]AGB41212.1 hypothetical protein Halha_1266 [Halobacteroides halobius DSM 5150]
MTNQDFNVNQLADVLGVDQEFIDKLGAEDIPQEKKELLESILTLYLTNPAEFEDFVAESGLDDLLTKLDNIDGTNPQNEEELAKLVDKLQQQLQNKDVDLNLDL